MIDVRTWYVATLRQPVAVVGHVACAYSFVAGALGVVFGATAFFGVDFATSRLLSSTIRSIILLTSIVEGSVGSGGGTPSGRDIGMFLIGLPKGNDVGTCAGGGTPVECLCAGGGTPNE